MSIRTGELPPVSNPMLTADAPRHYWRSTVYDEYMSADWLTSYATPQNVQANTALIPGLLDGYRRLHMNVELYQPEGKLFWSGLLYSADVPFRADWRVRPGSNLFADQAALLQADLFAADDADVMLAGGTVAAVGVALLTERFDADTIVTRLNELLERLEALEDGYEVASTTTPSGVTHITFDRTQVAR